MRNCFKKTRGLAGPSEKREKMVVSDKGKKLLKKYLYARFHSVIIIFLQRDDCHCNYIIHSVTGTSFPLS